MRTRPSQPRRPRPTGASTPEKPAGTPNRDRGRVVVNGKAIRIGRCIQGLLASGSSASLNNLNEVPRPGRRISIKRFLVRSAPETSRLLLDAPPRLLAELLFSGALERIVPHDRDPRTEETDDETLQRNLIDLLRSLSRDRVAHVEAEARRITTLAEDVAGELMTKMAVMQAFDDLPRQRDALARSLWCRLHHPRLFGHVERVLVPARGILSRFKARLVKKKGDL